MVVTNSMSIYENLKRLRDYGRVSRYEHVSLGYNSRLDALQAIFLSHKLKYLDQWNQQRRKNAVQYMERLKNLKIVLPYESYYANHVYHIFAIRTKKRDLILDKMAKAGIHCAVHYPVPLHLQKVYKKLGYKKGDFPIAEQVSKEILCLPMHPFLTKEQIKYICKTLERM